MLVTCAPTASPLVSGEPEPIVHVSWNDAAPLTVIDPPPIAVIEKSPAIADDETDELEELDELDDWLPGRDGSGRRRSISNRTPPSQTMRTVVPASSTWIDGVGESGVIRHVLPCTVIECAFSLVIAPLAIHLGVPAP